MFYYDQKSSYSITLTQPSVIPAEPTTSIEATFGPVVAQVFYTKVFTAESVPYMLASSASSVRSVKISTVNPSETGQTTTQTSTAHNSIPSTPPSSPSASGSTNAQNKGLSSGAAAGVGVGAAIGGILLASLVFFICFRRSRKSQPRYDSEVPLKRAPSYGESKPTGLPQITTVGTWESQAEKLLPQPVADDSISTEMSKLKSMINNHVVSYYRTSEIDLDSIDETALAGIVEDAQLSVSQLRSAIVDPQTRTPALRYLIVSAIFPRIGLKSHPSTSFLPPEVVSCLESMTGLRENDQGSFYLHFKPELKLTKNSADNTSQQMASHNCEHAPTNLWLEFHH